MQPLSGGSSHQIFLVEKPQGLFVIKKLNPLIMEKPQAKAHYRESEKIAAQFLKAGIPAVPALSQEDELTWVYPYVPGKPLYYPDLTQVHIRKIAGLLAKMHQAGTGLPFEKSMAEWPSQTIDALIPSALVQVCKQAKNRLCHDKLILSHRDFDPKNVLWQNDDPFIIDWESAGPIHPMEELVALAFEWSGLDQNTCDAKLFQTFFDEYRHRGGMIQIDLLQAGLYAFIANYVEWFDFNIRRLVKSGEASEKELAQVQIEKTLAKLEFLKNWSDNNQMNSSFFA